MQEGRLSRLSSTDFIIGLAGGMVAGVALSLLALFASGAAGGQTTRLRTIILTPTPAATATPT